MCDAIVRFNRWREHNSGYFYVRSRAEQRGEIRKLCSFLDLDDAYCFAEDDLADNPEAAWCDVSRGWKPPQHG